MTHRPSTDDRELLHARNPLVRNCARLADSTAFNAAILAVIVANAAVLGLETFEGVARRHAGTLGLANDLALLVFVAELAVRITAHGGNLARFARSGWNVFDAVVILAAFVPGLRENTTLLRLARLARVVRVVRLLPDLRVIFLAVGRALPAAGSLVVLTVLLLYVYGMVGWILFDGELAAYDTVLEAMLTLFVLLSLENLPDSLAAGRDVTGWAIPFFVSYVLVASFLVFNFFIGVVVNSLEQAREIEARREEAERIEHGGAPGPDPLTRVAALRGALDELEAELRRR